jgi:hypothetical protein
VRKGARLARHAQEARQCREKHVGTPNFARQRKGRQRSSNVSAWIEKFAPASVHVAAGVHPDPRAKAAKYSSVYL